VVKANNLTQLDIQCLPAEWHNTPNLIAPAVDKKIRAAKTTHERILVAYGDCGTGGLLDKVLEGHGVERLPGDHCYSFFAGEHVFNEMAETELGTFYLTDYLIDNFERLILDGLGISKYPELKDQYFSNYTRLMYLSQTSRRDEKERRLLAAQKAADALGLRLEIHETGLQPFEQSLRGIRITSV
jgi:hypothetical protein